MYTEPFSHLDISRRSFLMSALASMAARPTPGFLAAEREKRQTLYINQNADGLLSLGCPFDADGGPRVWTVLEVYHARWEGYCSSDPLTGRALDEALSDFGGGYADDPDFIEWLETPDPSNDSDDWSRPQWQEYIDELSASRASRSSRRRG